MRPGTCLCFSWSAAILAALLPAGCRRSQDDHRVYWVGNTEQTVLRCNVYLVVNCDSWKPRFRIFQAP